MKSTIKHIFVFHIHPFNYIYILLLSFFYEVYYYKSIGINNKLLIFFKKPKLEQLFKSDQYEFNAILGNAYDDFKKQLDISWTKYKTIYNYRNKKIDFTNQVMTNLIQDYEDLYKFSEISNYLSKLYKSKFLLILPYFKKELFDLGFIINLKNNIFSYNIISDLFFRNFILIKQVTILILKIIYKTKVNKKQLNYKILCQGINKQEIFKYGKNSCFYFFLGKDVISSNSVLFILPNKPSEKNIIEYKKNNINWMLNSEKYTFTSIKNSFIILISLLFNSKKILVNTNSNYLKFQTRICMLKSYIHYNFLKNNKFEVYLTNNSDLEIAGYNSSVAKALDIKTVMWQYSQAGIIPADFQKKRDNYNFCGRLVQSILFADYQFVWLQEDKKLFEERNLQPKINKPKFFISGPLMTGNGECFKYKQDHLRAEIFGHGLDKNVKVWICIFDLPTHDSKFKSYRAGLNRFSIEMQDKFFYDLILLLKKYDKIGLIYKPKRRISKNMFYLGKNLLKFINLKNDVKYCKRIVFLPNNIDPYIPFAISDNCIGVPFTSAVFAGNYYDKESIFYDPINVYKNCYPKKHLSLRLSNFQDLSKTIEHWILKKDKNRDQNKLNKMNPVEKFQKKLYQILNQK